MTRSRSESWLKYCGKAMEPEKLLEWVLRPGVLLYNLINMGNIPHVHLRSIDPARNRFRYYSLRLYRDLWGQQTLIRRYGRIGTRGHMHTELVRSMSEVKIKMTKLMESKKKRGYSLIPPSSVKFNGLFLGYK